MSNIKVNVEGAPEAVAKFFKEMGQPHFIENHVVEDAAPLSRIGDMEIAVNVDAEAVCNKITEKVSQDSDSKNDGPKEEKKTRKPRQKKEDKVEVTEEAPDSEFEGVPGEEVIEAQVTERDIIKEKVEETIKNEQETPEREISLPEVKEALKEYGLWIVEQGHESASAKDYLIALLRKYGEVDSTKDLKEEDYKKVFDAAVGRESMEALEEWK